jgi:spermidine synthase
MVLYKHDGEFIITVDYQDLMLSRSHESELQLAQLGCARVAAHRNPTVLIGGLGMGYTLRQTLDMLQPQATVVVAELIPEVVRWNRDYLGELTNHPLRDRRVTVKVGDVVEVIRQAPDAFDAILLDVDNGPNAITDRGNDRLYSREGLQACMRALHAKGSLAVWSSMFDRPFERRLRQENLHARCFDVPAYKGAKSNACCVWVASRERRSVYPDEGSPPQSPPRV